MTTNACQRKPTLFLRRPTLAACAALALVLPLTPNVSAAGQSQLAVAVAQLDKSRLASRSVSLADLGLREEIVLQAPESARELYLPVPANVPLVDATLELNGGYLRSNGGRTTMLLSLDGSPVVSRTFTQSQGDATVNIGVDGAPRSSGFVRVGANWQSVLGNDVCTDQSALGNVWRIDPSSRLTYRFDPQNVQDLRTAWNAMPQRPVVAIAARKIDQQAFDTARRAIQLLQRDDRQPVVRAWPFAGTTVDLASLDVPSPLREVPAFAALAVGGKHRIADSAEAGALIALAPAAIFAPDVIVTDDATLSGLDASMNALRAQIAAISTEAANEFDDWRARNIGPIERPLVAGEVRLARLAGQPVIVVRNAEALVSLTRSWRGINVTNRVVVHELEGTEAAGADRIALSLVGGEPRSFDIVDRGTWDANFHLGAVAIAGKIPDEVVLDVSAAPSDTGAGASLAIYFNDILIGSDMLGSDGKPQRVSAHIPRYALAPTNQIRAVFQRQPDGKCKGRDRGRPVAVLPGSHLTLVKADLDDDFTGMVARFASQAEVLVPAKYLADAVNALPRVARVAETVGIEPSRSSLTIVGDADPARPAGPFLAMDVTLNQEHAHVAVSHDRLLLTSATGKTLADVSGLTDIAAIEAVKSANVPGIAYRTLGGNSPLLPVSVRLSRGDVALVGDGGVLRRFDTQHPGNVLPTDDGSNWLAQRWYRWGVPLVIVSGFLILLLVAQLVRRKHREKS